MRFAEVLERLRTLSNPYPGLRPFETSESHLFFGRDRQVAELLARLDRTRFVAVVGVSGSGKSSLVRAGLIPALDRALLSEAGRHWRTVVTRPAGAPYERLADDLRHAGLDPTPLRSSSFGLIEIAGQLSSDESLLVIVDQFEELFRYKEVAFSDEKGYGPEMQAAEAADFVRLLLEAGRNQPPIYIVLTMRSDYLGDCAEFRDLPEALNDCQYLVPRMTREQRKEAITGPLGRVDIEPALVQRLLNAAGDEPDQLPVLQHALMRTWSRWHADDANHSRPIQRRDYEAIGCLGGALNQHAEELVAGTPLNITAAIFKRLTAKGRGSRERRNPATLAELWLVCEADTPERQQQVAAVVDRFRQGEATFLVPRDGPLQPDTYIDITHESLIRQWKTLRDDWLPDEQESAKTLLDLVGRARNWSGRKGALLSGLDLKAALEWNEKRNPSAAWAAYYAGPRALDEVEHYIQESEEQRRAEEATRREERRRRRQIRAALILLIVAIPMIAGVFLHRQARQARRAAIEAKILSVPSLRDPLTRALVLAELTDQLKNEFGEGLWQESGDAANDSRDKYLRTFQETAAAAIPFAVYQPPEEHRALAVGFLANGRAAVVLDDASVWSWTTDGRGHADLQGRAADANEISDASDSKAKVAAISPDGRWIALGWQSGRARLLRLDNERRTDLETESAMPVASIAFSHDSRLLAIAYSNSGAGVWRLDAASGSVVALEALVLSVENSGPISIAFDRAGRILTADLTGTIRRWTLGVRSAASSIDEGLGSITSVAVSPAGAIVTGYPDGRVRLHVAKRRDANESPLLEGFSSAVTAMDFSPDGRYLMTAAADGIVRVFMLRQRQAVATGDPVISPLGTPMVLEHAIGQVSATFSSDGQWLLTASADGRVSLWPSRQAEPRIVGIHRGRVESVAFSANGQQLLSASDDNTAALWSLDEGTERGQILAGHSNWVRSAAFNPNDERKVLTASDDGTLRLWNLAAPGAARARVTGEASVVFEAWFNHDGDRVVTAVRDNTTRVWNTDDLIAGGASALNADGTRVVELPHPGWVLGAAFSHSGSTIATASQDGVRVWDPDRDPHEPTILFDFDARANSAAFSPDDRRLAAAFGEKGFAKVWPVDDTSPLDESGSILTLRHRNYVNDAVFSPRGTWVATSSTDGTAVLWDALDGRERVVLKHGTEDVRAIAFDADDSLVVTGTSAGIVRVWRMDLRQLADHVADVTTACLRPEEYVRLLNESEHDGLEKSLACERMRGRTPVEGDGSGAKSLGAGPNVR